MRFYKKLGTEKKQDVEGRHYWLAIVAFASGATVQMDDGMVIPVSGNWVLRPPLDTKDKPVPWKQLTTTGAITMLIGENREPAPPNAGQLVPTSTGQFISTDVIVATNNVFVALVPPNTAQRGVLIQNHAVVPVVLSEVITAGVAGGVGSKLLAVLSACAVAYDGTGGVFEIDNVSDSIFGAGVGANADVSVNVW